MEGQQNLERLKICVASTLGRKLVTPKDFDFLSEHIFSRLHVVISATTLKRLWGYLKESTSPRISTLDVLSRFVGYADWNEFCMSAGETAALQSDFIISRCLRCEQLKCGDKVLVTWLPDRKCEFEYLGDGNFKVSASENAKIKVGSTFRCSVFIEGEPLYIDHLKQEGIAVSSYVAGKVNGIRFEVIEA